MLKKTIIGALAAATALTAIPTAAQAQRYRDGYYGRHHRNHYRPRSRVYVQTYYAPGYGGYYDPYYGRGYYPYPDRYYGGGYYDRGYYDRGYYRSGYYGRRGYKCDNGTTGAIVGGAAGALVGREIGRDGRGYRYRYGRYGRRGGGATGAIIGGALGALIGSQATRC